MTEPREISSTTALTALTHHASLQGPGGQGFVDFLRVDGHLEAHITVFGFHQRGHHTSDHAARTEEVRERHKILETNKQTNKHCQVTPKSFKTKCIPIFGKNLTKWVRFTSY